MGKTQKKEKRQHENPWDKENEDCSYDFAV
jgi:hypothetical protein